MYAFRGSLLDGDRPCDRVDERSAGSKDAEGVCARRSGGCSCGVCLTSATSGSEQAGGDYRSQHQRPVAAASGYKHEQHKRAE